VLEVLQLEVAFDQSGGERGIRSIIPASSGASDTPWGGELSSYATPRVQESIAFTGNNPFNLTIGGGDWQGATTQEGGREAVGHRFETFSDPAYGFRAGFLNLIVKNDRNIAQGKENSLWSILREVTPYEQNKEFWDGGGDQGIADRLSTRLGRKINVHDHIDLNNEELGRAFGTEVANMEMGTQGDPWGNQYERGFDLAYRTLRQQQERFAEEEE
jgi:hypothetical protein